MRTLPTQAVNDTPFRRLLGPRLDALPVPLRIAHDGECVVTLRGTAQVWRSPNPAAQLLCELMRLPRAGRDVPVTVSFDRRAAPERQHRRFGRRCYASRLRAENGRLVERMGLATNVFRLDVSNGALCIDLVGFRVLGLPVPAWLRPRCQAVERAVDGLFSFDIPVSLPGFGPVIRYSGLVAPVREGEP